MVFDIQEPGQDVHDPPLVPPLHPDSETDRFICRRMVTCYRHRHFTFCERPFKRTGSEMERSICLCGAQNHVFVSGSGQEGLG